VTTASSARSTAHLKDMLKRIGHQAGNANKAKHGQFGTPKPPALPDSYARQPGPTVYSEGVSYREMFRHPGPFKRPRPDNDPPPSQSTFKKVKRVPTTGTSGAAATVKQSDVTVSVRLTFLPPRPAPVLRVRIMIPPEEMEALPPLIDLTISPDRTVPPASKPTGPAYIPNTADLLQWLDLGDIRLEDLKAQQAKPLRVKKWRMTQPSDDERMLLFDVVQNSQVWLDARDSSVGASSLDVLVGRSGYLHNASLWMCDTGRASEGERDPNEMYASQRGHKMEDGAAELYEILTGARTWECGILVNPHRAYTHASVDRMVEFSGPCVDQNPYTARDPWRGCLEIKNPIHCAATCRPRNWEYTRYVHKIPPHYLLQVQGQISAAEPLLATLNGSGAPNPPSQRLLEFYENHWVTDRPTRGPLWGDFASCWVANQKHPLWKEQCWRLWPVYKASETLVSRTYASRLFMEEVFKYLDSHVNHCNSGSEIPPKVVRDADLPDVRIVPRYSVVFWVSCVRPDLLPSRLQSLGKQWMIMDQVNADAEPPELRQNFTEALGDAKHPLGLTADDLVWPPWVCVDVQVCSEATPKVWSIHDLEEY
jgi:putative phage-type endonuclease